MIDLKRVPRGLFGWALESNLLGIARSSKAHDHFLEALRIRLEADAAWLYHGPRRNRADGKPVLAGPRELCDERLVRAFARHEKPELPRNLLLSPLRVHGRLLGVVGAARRGRDFELGQGRVLNKLTSLLSRDLARRENERVDRILDRIREKVVAELRPRDLAYQILHGLHQLVNHDHSASLLTYDGEASVFRVEAEKIIWKKTESNFIGHEIPAPPGLLKDLQRSAEVRIFSGGEAAGGSSTHGLFGRLLDYYGGQGIPAAPSLLCAPLFFDGELLGLLKLATWKRTDFDQHDVEVVKRFLPAAAVALRNVRVRLSLEDQAVQAELRAGLVTLARAVAHDVNNAIGGILPLAEQLREELEAGSLDPRALKQDLDVIVANAALCKRIFSNMLRIAAERAGGGPVDVNRVVRAMLPILESQVAPRRISLQLILAEALPVIRFSKDHLERIVWNLVTNSIEALGTKAGDPGRIEIATRAFEDGGVVLSVRDNGPGIDAETLKQVQEPFFTTRHGGTGLGLAICRSLAWQYGGRLRVLSEPGSGTEVRLQVPAQDRANPAGAK